MHETPSGHVDSRSDLSLSRIIDSLTWKYLVFKYRAYTRYLKKLKANVKK